MMGSMGDTYFGEYDNKWNRLVYTQSPQLLHKHNAETPVFVCMTGVEHSMPC